MSVYTPYYSPVYGSGFPYGVLDVSVELNLGGDWTGITSYVLQREGTSPAITITRGKPDETSQATPGQCGMQWKNPDGRFSPRNPVGPYYGLLGRNTPLRVSVPDSGTSLRIEDDRMSLAEATGFTAITGDIDIRLEMDLDDWQPCSLAGGNEGWSLVLNGDGTIGLLVDATTLYSSAQPVPLGHIAVRVTRAESSGVITFYISSDGTIGGTWGQLGAVVTSTAGALAGGPGLTVGYTSLVPEVLGSGYSGPAGRFYDFEVYSGIGGTLEAEAAFSSQAAGTVTWTDGQGNAWAVAGSATIDGRSYRGHFECSSLPQQWDPTGTDVWTPVTASGVLRRLQQGNAPVPSAMKRAIQSLISSQPVVAYWTGEDPQGSTLIASGLPGARGMTFAGQPGFQGTAGSPSVDSVFACSAQIAQVQASIWSGTVPAYTSTGNDAVTFLLYVPSGAVPNGTTLLTVAVGGHTLSVLYNTASGGELSIQQDGITVSVSPLTLVNGVPMLAQLNNIVSSTSVTLTTLALYATATQFTAGTSAASGPFTRILVNQSGVACGATELGHIWVTPNAPDLTTLAGPLAAWGVETAGNRVARLLAENGIVSRVYGPPDLSATMGPQTIDTLVNLLQYCETSDRGMLYEPAEVLGVGYRTLHSMCGQAPGATFNYADATLGGDGSQGLVPVDDDQHTINDATVSRNGGSSYQVQVTTGPVSISPPPDGAGDYATQITAYVAYDSQVPHIAGWVTWIGTADEERYPAVPLNLARPQLSSLTYDIQNTRLGDFFQITGLPSWLPPGPASQLAYGVTEKLGGYWYATSWNAVPEDPYEVLTLDDVVLGHLESDGSELAAGVSSGATTLSVATTGPSGVLWTTNAGDFPFDIEIGGEQITVTNITGASSPQAFTVTRSVNGVVKAQPVNAPVTLFREPVLALA